MAHFRYTYDMVIVNANKTAKAEAGPASQKVADPLHAGLSDPLGDAPHPDPLAQPVQLSASINGEKWTEQKMTGQFTEGLSSLEESLLYDWMRDDTARDFKSVEEMVQALERATHLQDVQEKLKKLADDGFGGLNAPDLGADYPGVCHDLTFGPSAGVSTCEGVHKHYKNDKILVIVKSGTNELAHTATWHSGQGKWRQTMPNHPIFYATDAQTRTAYSAGFDFYELPQDKAKLPGADASSQKDATPSSSAAKATGKAAAKVTSPPTTVAIDSADLSTEVATAAEAIAKYGLKTTPTLICLTGSSVTHVATGIAMGWRGKNGSIHTLKDLQGHFGEANCYQLPFDKAKLKTRK
jgi:hypothetical protein